MCVYGRYAPALDNLFPAVVDVFTTYTILALRFCPFLRPLLKVIVFIYSLANHDNPLPQLTRANGRLTIKSTRLRKRQSVPHVLLVYCSYSATQKISTFMSGFIGKNHDVCRKSEFWGEKIFYFLATFSYVFD